jgi:disulfide bond formation protein DsbB
MTGAMWETRRDAAAARVALAVAGVLALTLAGAWAFQILGDMAPCPLCLQQRWPYYLGAPLAAALALAATRGVPACVIAGGGALLALLLLWSVGMGVFHAGVEYKLWPGPTDCAAAAMPPIGAGNLLAAISRSRVVACDEAPWTLLGVSLAGFNALISAGLLTLFLMALTGRAPLGPRAP